MRNRHSSPLWLKIIIYAFLLYLILFANYFLFWKLLIIEKSSYKDNYASFFAISGIARVSIICIDVFSAVYLVCRVTEKRAAKIKRLAKERKRQEIEEYKNSIQDCLDSLSRKEIGKIDFSNIPYKYFPEEYHWAKQKQEQEERSGVSRRTVKLEDLLQ